MWVVFTLPPCPSFTLSGSQSECLTSNHSKHLQQKLLRLRTPTVAKYSKPKPGMCVRAWGVRAHTCTLQSKWLLGKNVFVIVPSTLPVDNTAN